MFNKVSTGKRYPYAVIIPNTYNQNTYTGK